MNQPRDGHGQFAPKLGEEKKLRSLRLTDTAWNKLQEVADFLSLTKTDAVEQLARWGVPPDDEQIILEAIDKFIESQRGHAGGNQHKPAGELRTTGRDWRKLNEFRSWVEDE